MPARELARLEQRVDDARKTLAALPQAPPDDVCRHIERSHRAVDAAEKNLLAAKRRGLRADLIDLRNSGDTAGDKKRVVGYGAFAFYER